jgi:hypothetical protein
MAAREILSAAWPLFKACLPLCLPLAIVGVAAGATPGAEAASSGGARGMAYTREWWGVAAASMLLVLICYGAVLRQQFAIAEGGRLPLLESLRRAAMDVPNVLLIIVVLLVPLLPAMLLTAWHGFSTLPALLTVLAGAVLLYGWLAWPALVARQAGALTAIGISVALVRGRWNSFLQLGFSLLAAVLVFVLLFGIFVGVVMGLAGQATPDARGLALSRVLMGLILALPVVYGGAVTVSAWRAAVRLAPASRGAAAPPPAP